MYNVLIFVHTTIDGARQGADFAVAPPEHITTSILLFHYVTYYSHLLMAITIAYKMFDTII